jgi:acyl carrier protein
VLVTAWGSGVFFLCIVLERRCISPRTKAKGQIEGKMTKELDTSGVQAMVRDFLVERFEIPQEKLTSDASLRELGLDSIMMLDVLLEVEDRLGIKLRDLSMAPNAKLSDVVALVERNLALKS